VSPATRRALVPRSDECSASNEDQVTPGILVIVVGLLFVVPSAVGYYTDWLWFRELGYDSVFLRSDFKSRNSRFSSDDVPRRFPFYTISQLSGSARAGIRPAAHRARPRRRRPARFSRRQPGG
jgi:hypothetical protein